MCPKSPLRIALRFYVQIPSIFPLRVATIHIFHFIGVTFCKTYVFLYNKEEKYVTWGLQKLQKSGGAIANRP